MVEFKKNMYISKKVKNVSSIKRRLLLGQGVADAYLLGITPGSNFLEIVSSTMYKQKALRRMGIEVVGIAGSKQDALELVETIAKDTYNARGDYNIFDYVRSIQ